MLKHIPKMLTPDLFRVIMEMGHGEELLLCDANYPAKSGAGERVYLSGCLISELLEILLYYFPLDDTVEYAAVVMESCRDLERGRYGQYEALIEKSGSRLEAVERHAFYLRANGVVAKVITTDMIKGGNILLKKGVVTQNDLCSRYC